MRLSCFSSGDGAHSILKKGISAVLILSLGLGLAPVYDSYAYDGSAMHIVSEVSEAETTSLSNKLNACFNNAINTDAFRSSFNTAEDAYNSASNELKEAVRISNSGSYVSTDNYTNLEDLIQLAYSVTSSISTAENIRTGSTGITENTYPSFANAMSAISNGTSGALDSYLSKYDELKNQDAFKTCLPDTNDAKYYLINNTSYEVISTSDGLRITSNSSGAKYYDTIYNKLLQIYTVENAYLNLRSNIGSDTQLKTGGFTSSVLSYLSDFSNLVDANGGSSTISSLNRYNGSEISALLLKYSHISTYLTALDAVVEHPETEEQMKAAINAYSLYNSLTSDEKEMITADDVIRMNTYCITNTGVSALIEQIDAITWPTSDDTYKTFNSAYTTALNAYNALLKQYGSSSGVENLVTNRDKLLGDMAGVKSIIDRIVDIEKVKANDPASMCGLYTVDMTKLNNDYEELSAANKSHVYNWADYYKIYTDTKSAYDLRARIDRLDVALTSEDESEVKAIRSAYSELSTDAKVYFGSTYANKISILEYSIYALSANNAGAVMDLIDKIGTVTSNSGPKIIAAENAYNQLTANEKLLVKNYATLAAARAEYNKLRTDISSASVSGVKTGYVFTGSKIKPVPVVKVDGVVLVKGVDYTLSYTSNKNVGTGYVTITAVDGSGFKGTYKKSFKIVKDSIANCGISGLKSSYKYTGKAIKPTFKVKVNGIYIKKGTDYTVTYKNNKKKGKATITIKGKGNYKGSRKKTFKIK